MKLTVEADYLLFIFVIKQKLYLFMQAVKILNLYKFKLLIVYNFVSYPFNNI